jgi:uncharacterized protein
MEKGVINMLNETIIKQLATQENIKEKQVTTVLTLLEEGNTVPFIARYRKEMTGALDEEQIFNIQKEYQYALNLTKRKEDVIRLIDEKGMLTPELKKKIEEATKLVTVEDLYLPYKEKKKTKATEAIKLGLEPLAKMMMSFPKTGDLNEMAKKYVTGEVKTVEDAIQGAKYIIAEWVSERANLRGWVRSYYMRSATMETKIKKNAEDEKKVYEMYYDYKEALKSIKEHRVLAINRAEKEKIISAKLSVNEDKVKEYLYSRVIKNKDSFVVDAITDAIDDSFKRLIKPSIEREVRKELSEKAEGQAISIFSKNLYDLLMQPPMKGKMVLGVDPAYRTGCKLAVVDETGKFYFKSVIYPHPPKAKRAEAFKLFKEVLNKYPIEIIAIGNGTASRETEEFVAEAIKDVKRDLAYLIVNEAGASVYSASDEARDEFPDLQVEERSAISIARRLQDPLAELVKIDPKSIGVGQYQHDVAQNKLNEELNFVIETSVNKVGVDVNTASTALLQSVSGVSKTIAKNIIASRDELGKFSSRNELKKVKRFGAKSFEQAIGFLRIPDGTHPFDATPIHPESYKQAEEVLKLIGGNYDELGKDTISVKIDNADFNALKERTKLDEYTLQDILDSFKQPMRDPRDEVAKPLLKKGVMTLEDINVGMELQGTVRNVVDFGAFVDIGIKQDGLVHISKICDEFIKHPLDKVSIGQIVTVWVSEIFKDKGKVGLTMIKPKDQ